MAEVLLSISVVYALPERQQVVHLHVEGGTTVGEAIARSGLTQQFAELGSATLNCAIYGRVVPITQVVAAGDRIEILRPLLIDPKESRRQAAARTKRK